MTFLNQVSVDSFESIFGAAWAAWALTADDVVVDLAVWFMRNASYISRLSNKATAFLALGPIAGFMHLLGKRVGRERAKNF